MRLNREISSEMDMGHEAAIRNALSPVEARRSADEVDRTVSADSGITFEEQQTLRQDYVEKAADLLDALDAAKEIN